jgi:hypothetical protein
MIAEIRPFFLTEFTTYLNELLSGQNQNQILNKIKKPALYSPDKPSSDSGKITGLSLNEDNTLSTFMVNERYPVNTYPDIQTVWFTAYYKNVIPLIANSLAKQNWFQRIITVLALKWNFNVFPEWFERMSKMGHFLLKDEYYCKPVKELRKILKGKIDERVLDAMTLVLEYDSAYRFMLQDILPILDKEKFDKEPIKELQRLFDIFISRNDGGEQKMINIFKFIKFYLKVNRKLLKQVKEIVKDLNLKEIDPSDADRYWMLYLRAYRCFGLDPENAQKQYLKLKNYKNESNF